MTPEQLQARFRELCQEDLSAPGGGKTSERFHRIFQAGREDLSLAKLAEAHWDAVAILREAGREPAPDTCYAVWASEVPGRELRMEDGPVCPLLHGVKEFCSGAGLVDRALVTAGANGSCLVEVALKTYPNRLSIDSSGWEVDAFRMTQTSAVCFDGYPATLIGEHDWYTRRPGFWKGAVNPAAAWAGGAAALLEYVMLNHRDDPHTAAHRGAMHSNVWVMQCVLDAAAREFDAEPECDATVRALEVRHHVEQLCTDTLRRFARCMGPAPLARNCDIARRYAELDLYVRQSHGERDLESLGRALRQTALDARKDA